MGIVSTVGVAVWTVAMKAFSLMMATAPGTTGGGGGGGTSTVSAISFTLKTPEEQMRLLYEFGQGLKKFGLSFQVVIQTDKLDIQNHIDSLQKKNKHKEYLSDMIDDYLQMVRQKMKEKEILSRKYFIIVPEHEQGKENFFGMLEQIGNPVSKLDEEALGEMLTRCFRKCTSFRRDTNKWV